MMVNDTLHAVVARVRSAKRPAAFVSFGKDSMAMLGLLREAGVLPHVELVTIRHPSFINRYAFADRVIAEWSLSPRVVYHGWNSTIAGNGRVDLLGTVRVGNTEIHIPVANMLTECSTEPVLCALDNEIAQGADLASLDFDLVLVGTKRDDVDPVVGPVQLKEGFEENPGGPSLFFPLCEWTDADVWAYLIERDVPFDTARYLGATADSITDDVSYPMHPEYLPVCTACLNPVFGDEVFCPKVGAVIPSRAVRVLRRSYPPKQNPNRPEIVAL